MEDLRRGREANARSRLFGFLMGTVLAGGGLYYYVVDEYKVSNELLVGDIYVSGFVCWVFVWGLGLGLTFFWTGAAVGCAEVRGVC